APVRPQRDADRDRLPDLVQGLRNLLAGRRAGPDQQRAERLAGRPSLLLETPLQRLAADRAAAEQDLAHAQRGPAGAREHRLPVLDVELGALAGALQLEPPGGRGEPQELEDLGGEELGEVSLERRGAHRAPQRTSPTTRPGAAR